MTSQMFISHSAEDKAAYSSLCFALDKSDVAVDTCFVRGFAWRRYSTSGACAASRRLGSRSAA